MSDKAKLFIDWGTKIGALLLTLMLLAVYSKLDERYVTKDQYRQDRDQLRDDLKEMRNDIKALLRRP